MNESSPRGESYDAGGNLPPFWQEMVLGFDGAAGRAVVAMRPGGELHYAVIDETHLWTAEDMARFAAIAGMVDGPTWARSSVVDAGASDGRSIMWTNPSSPDTSREYFLDLIRRIDDVTEGSPERGDDHHA